MKILVACEESQRVTSEFRMLGHEAYSADIIDQSGGHPEWHIKGDALRLINGNCNFVTTDGEQHDINGKWDMIIAFPPCTYLTSCGNRWFNEEKYGEKARQRKRDRKDAMQFFMKFVNADCDKIVIENPRGIMNSQYRKPDQVVSPYMFADSVNDKENYVTKTTCFWLKGVMPLETNDIEKPDNAKLFGKYSNGKNKTWEDCSTRSAKIRSKTFPGVAKAMATQWG